jgi:hypothetical protein
VTAVDIQGIGLLAPGLIGWEAGRAVLAGLRPFEPVGIPDPEAALLPPNERRRSSESVRWAVQVAQEAIGQSGLDPRDVPTVFASSEGEMDVFDTLCRMLTTKERLVSPTVFHQSVHNTAAGYWGIATGGQQSSTALSCYDDTFAAGLLEAATIVHVEHRPVLLVAYDLNAPMLFREARPITSGFSVALVLVDRSTSCVARLQLRLESAHAYEGDRLHDAALERIRQENPAARSLSLLRAIAIGGSQSVGLNLLDAQRPTVEVESCCN